MELNFGTNFWAGVGLAAAIATALATALTVVVSVWWRRVDQARPTWLLADGESTWGTPNKHGNETFPSASGHAANVGTGSGHHVQAVGLGCRVELSQVAGPVNQWGGVPRRLPSYEPVAPSGWEMDLTVYCEPSDWDQAKVAILWSTPSLWRAGMKKHIQVFELRDFASRPTLGQQVEDPTTGIPQAVPQREPERRVLPDSLKPQQPLPTAGWRQRRSQRRALLRDR